MKRYRWFCVKLPYRLEKLMMRLRSERTPADADFWFAEPTDSSDEGGFRFLWRSQILVTRLNTSGEEMREPIAILNVIDGRFIAHAGQTFIRLVDPPRNLTVLLNALESIVGFGFTIKAMTFDHVKAESVFRRMQEIRLVGLKVINVVLNPDCVGRMEFASKRGVVLEKLRPLRGLNYKIDWAAYEVAYKGLRGSVALSNAGVARISGPLGPRLLNCLELALMAKKGLRSSPV